MAHAAFFSYVHRDDADDQSGISVLRARLESEWSMQVGDHRSVWMDRTHIAWGEDWKDRIDEALLSTSFFIPIVTPRYFLSAACRDELFTFSTAATRLGLEELIMPIYYVDVTGFGESEDEAMELVRRFQYEDWRRIRLANRQGSTYRTALARLAGRLRRAELKADSKPTPSTAGEQPADEPGVEPDETDGTPAVLDTMADGEAAVHRLAANMNGISALTREVGDLFSASTEEIHKSDRSNKGFAGRLAVSRRLAAQLGGPVDAMEELSRKAVADVVAIDAMLHAFFELLEAADEDTRARARPFLTALTQLDDQASEGLASGERFADTLREAKDWSKDLRRPISRLERAIRQFTDTRQFFSRWAERAKRHL